LKKRFVLAVVILGLVVGVWFLIAGRQTEDSRIRHRLNLLAEMLSDTGDNTGQDLLIRPVKLGKFFAEDVVVVVSDRLPEIKGRDSLVAMAERAMRQTSSMSVSFADMEVMVNPDDRHAQVNITVLVSGADSAEATSVNAQEFELHMAKLEGEWVIKSVRPVEVMELD